VQTWRDTDALLEHTITANPRSYLGQNNLGTLLINRGAQLLTQGQSQADAAAGRAMMDAGELRLKKALEIWPDYPAAWNSLSIYYLKTGRIEEALDTRQKAADAYDRLPPVLMEGSRMRVALAQACLKNGRREQAITNLKAFLERNPGDAEATTLLEQAMASPPGN
jgi:tetratricopeptide (TPR) repeat protein